MEIKRVNGCTEITRPRLHPYKITLPVYCVLGLVCSLLLRILNIDSCFAPFRIEYVVPGDIEAALWIIIFSFFGSF